MTSLRDRLLVDVVRPALVDRAPRDHHEPMNVLRRRRIVVTATLIVGAALLGFSLAAHPDNATFYGLTLALAATWVIGAFASGPLHLGRVDVRGSMRRPLITPLLIGLAIAGVFVLGALVVREIEPLRHLVHNVIDHAQRGSMPVIAIVTVVNGIAEELFFRGAVYAAVTRRPALLSTVVYTVVTIASGNVMLVFAAVTLGSVLALQRRASGGVLASSITHVTWSLIMLFALTPLFR